MGRNLPAKHYVVQNTKRYDLSSFITSLATTQLPKNLTEHWKLHSKENPGVPDIDELLDFMSDYADATEGSILTSTKSEPWEPIKKPKVEVYNKHSLSVEREQVPVLPVDWNTIHCTSAMLLRQCRWRKKQAHVRNHHLCFNCVSCVQQNTRLQESGMLSEVW